jgi:hypothetical protein
VLSLAANLHGIAMKFSAGKVRRKWPCGGFGGIEAAKMVTAVTALAMLCAQAGPAAAVQKRDAWSQGPSQGPWGDLFRPRAPKPRRVLSASVPLPKPRPADAPAIQPEKPAAATPPATEAAKPAEPAAPAPPPLSACRLALTEAIAIAPSIPDIHGPGGCGGEDLVRLEAVVLPDKRQVAVTPPATLRCPMASAIADWIRTDVTSLAAGLGTEPVVLDNFDSYECRGFNRVAGAHLSEHGRANALDVRSIKLANGQSIGLTDRTVARDLRETVLHSVCTRFMTVLGPGSDWYHEDHIHLDLMERHNNYKICQWNVLDPLPQVAPLLPAARPEEASPREVAAKSDAGKSDSGESDPDVTSPATKKRRQDRRF